MDSRPSQHPYQRRDRTCGSGSCRLRHFWYCEHSQAEAAKKLGDALVTYNAPILAETAQGSQMVSFPSAADRAKAAKKQFYAISSEYGFTSAGQWAHYFAALCEVDLGNYPVAEGQLKDVEKSSDMEVSRLAGWCWLPSIALRKKNRKR